MTHRPVTQRLDLCMHVVGNAGGLEEGQRLLDVGLIHIGEVINAYAHNHLKGILLSDKSEHITA